MDGQSVSAGEYKVEEKGKPRDVSGEALNGAQKIRDAHVVAPDAAGKQRVIQAHGEVSNGVVRKATTIRQGRKATTIQAKRARSKLQTRKLNGSSPSGKLVLTGASARKLSTLVSREPARVGSLLSNELSAEAVQLLIPAVPNRSSSGSGSVSALAAGALASPISAAGKRR